MKILIVGNGGREHALAWKAAQSRAAENVYVAPGNAGTALEPGVENINIAADDIKGLIKFAADQQVDLTIIGPEAPLVCGIVDAFNNAGLRCFGPYLRSARLEGSKSFSKDFLHRHRIPTAEYETFTDLDKAIKYICLKGTPIVIKADGLAAGKGVIIARSEDEAVTAVTDMLAGNKFGDAGNRVVIEEYLSGEEASFIVISDGRNILPMASSQDHKARDDGDEGPNTGGMGAYSPAPVVDDNIHRRIMREIIEPTITGMREEGNIYIGFLYAGVMVMPDGTPKVLEFNCRLGDPETQPIMMRLRSDLVALCDAALDGNLAHIITDWDEQAAVGVVLAANGYPENPRRGDVINGIDTKFEDSVKVFHAGTVLNDHVIKTAGGRVLCITALGKDVSAARQVVYDAINEISWDGMFYRKDIGHRAVNREKRINTG